MQHSIQERIGQLTQEISKGIYGKDRECRLAMLAALAGESIILLGPPGVAKSMIARRMKRAFVGAQSFEYLMNRFSTPDEIFGPVSISRLKSEDVYERTVEGFLPTADVVFLDDEHLYIDGVRYELRRRANDEEASIESELAAADKASGMLSNDNTVACTNNLSNEKTALVKEMRSNVFCNADDIKAVEKYANEVGHNIAEVRGILAEIDKLQL